MGGFLSLIKPGLQYNDPSSATDPATGQPIQVKPRVAFFPNNQARNEQFVKDAHNAIQSAPMTIDSATGAPVLGTPNLPKPVQPSFSSVSGPDAHGMPQTINPAETKLGKLLHIMMAGATGAMNGYGQMTPAAGAEAARDIPFQRAARVQSLQAGEIQNQQAQANLATNPLNIAQKIAAIQAQQAETEKSLHGVHSTVFQPDPNNQEGYVQQGVDAFGKPTGQGIPAMLPGFLKPHTQLVTVPNPQNPNGPPIYAEYDKLLHVVRDPTSGAVIPGAEKFVPGLVPKTSTDTSSASTDLMGNTVTKNTRTTGPAVSGPNGLTPGQPRFAPTSTARTTAPTAGAPKAAAPSTDNSPVFRLSPDVEQRLAASKLSPQEQQYARGLLSYKGQMPSSRAKNYPATLATLTSLDPNFNATNYDTIRKTKMDYTPGGSVGSQVLAFNTAMRHVGMLNDAVDSLGNVGPQFVNRLKNALSVQLGKDPVTNFSTIKTYLAGELAKGFGGGVATDSSRAEANDILSKIQSPEQLHGGLINAVGLLRGKIGAQEDAYKKQTGQPISLLDDEANAVIKKMSGPTPQSHVFSLSGWKAANPNGDINAATAAAKAKGFEVTQ